MANITSTPFHPDFQNSSNDALIIAALERVGEAFRVMLWEQAKNNGLSPIQVQTLIFLYSHADSMATVTYLAREMNVTKATMSDVVKTLAEKKFLIRKDNPFDTRTQILKLTASGKKMAITTGAYANTLLKQIAALTERQKMGLKTVLLDLIYTLYQEKVITMQRMCFTCTHFSLLHDKHYCNLLKMPLTPDHLRLDCPEHELKHV